jgi:hypothetical protein
MSHQPNLFSPRSTNGLAVSDPKTAAAPASSLIPVWLRRVELFFFVVLRIYVGIVVMVLPWTPPWTGNRWINYFPRVSALLMTGAVRGIVSGLGLLNLWSAVGEAIHYREPSA